MRKLRVIQYATGITGKIAIRALADRSDFELVGLLVWNKDKVGKDAGEIAGLGRKLGVVATDKLEDILAIDADAVSFMGLWPDLDLVCPMLESGKHVVLTCGLVYPKYLGPKIVERIEAACKKGNSCVFGGGISPGYAQCVAPITLSNLARRVDSIVIEEFVDFHDVAESVELIGNMLGFGRGLDEVTNKKHPHFDEMMPEFFNQTVALTADTLMLDYDAIEHDIRYFVSPGGGKIACLDIPPGCAGGARSTFRAMKDGQPRISVVLNWACTYDLGEGWFSESELSNSTQWRVTVHGDPSMRLSFEQADSFAPGEPNRRKSTEHSFAITVMNVLHAIPYLAAEKSPGIKHYGNLPLMGGPFTMRDAVE